VRGQRRAPAACNMKSFSNYMVDVTLFRLKSSDDSGEEENGTKDLQKAEKEFLVNAVCLFL